MFWILELVWILLFVGYLLFVFFFFVVIIDFVVGVRGISVGSEIGWCFDVFFFIIEDLFFFF